MHSVDCLTSPFNLTPKYRSGTCTSTHNSHTQALTQSTYAIAYTEDKI